MNNFAETLVNYLSDLQSARQKAREGNIRDAFADALFNVNKVQTPTVKPGTGTSVRKAYAGSKPEKIEHRQFLADRAFNKQVSTLDDPYTPRQKMGQAALFVPSKIQTAIENPREVSASVVQYAKDAGISAQEFASLLNDLRKSTGRVTEAVIRDAIDFYKTGKIGNRIQGSYQPESFIEN